MLDKLGMNFKLLGNDLIVPNKRVISIEPLQAFYSRSGSFNGVETILPFVNVNTVYYGTVSFSTLEQQQANVHKSLHIYASDNITNYHILTTNGNAIATAIQMIDLLFWRMTSHIIDQSASDLTTAYFNGYKLGLESI